MSSWLKGSWVKLERDRVSLSSLDFRDSFETVGFLNQHNSLTFNHFYQIKSVGLSQSHALYDEVEQQYSSYIDKGIKTFTVALSIEFLSPLLQPLQYSITNQPEPNDWVLPNGFM